MSLPTVMITSEKTTQKSMTRPSLSVPNAPLTTLDASGPSGTSTATSASFAFSPNETGSKFECSLEGAPFAECASPKEYTGLSAGGHELRVRSIDRAGNIDGSPESRTWTVQAQLTCAAKTGTAKGSAESSVYQKTPVRNNGTDAVLRVNSRTGERTRSLVRFAIPTIPTGCQVASAELDCTTHHPRRGVPSRRCNSPATGPSRS